MNEQQIAELKTALESKVAEGLISIKDMVNTLKASVDGFGTQIEIVKSKLAISLPGVDLGKKESEKFSFVRAYQAMHTKSWKLAPFEKEIYDQVNEKAFAAGTGATGGYIVPVEFSRNLIELLYAQSVVMQMGATRLNPTGIPFEIPKQVGGASATWADENQAMTETSGSFGKISMTPKYLTALVKMSDRMIAYSDPSLEALVRKDIIRAMDLELDKKSLLGDGTNNSPIGLLNQPGISTLATATDGDDANYDFLLDLEGKVEDANAMVGELGFISCPAVWRKLKKQKAVMYSGGTAGLPIYQPIMTPEQLKGAIGNFGSTTQIPKNRSKGGTTGTISSVYYGNWSEMMIAFWGSLVLKTSEHAGFGQNQVHLKAVMEADVAIRHGESFAVATDVLTV